MNKKSHRKQLLQDLCIVIFSVWVAVFVSGTGVITSLISYLNNFSYLGVFFSGMFFTSVFTTPVSIALLSGFSKVMPPAVVALFGGAGAVVGDYIIFRFVRDRVAEDIAFLVSAPERRRLSALFHKRLFRFFLPFVGALIIASPLPDELGVALLGFSAIPGRMFFIISFVMNGSGILAIGLITKVLGV